MALRGEKVGQQLMNKTLETCTRPLACRPVYLGAQAHLQRNFYQSFGFIPVTEVYEEDGIHIEMAREVIQA